MERKTNFKTTPKFRLVLMQNGKYKKTIYTCNSKETAYIRLNELKAESESVHFPKQWINYNDTISPVKYKTLLIKLHEDGDKSLIQRDEHGKILKKSPLSGKWTIIAEQPHQIEETFYVYGMDFRKNRPTIKTIIKLMGKNGYRDNFSKQITRIFNKILIYDGEIFNLIICKCEEDAKRLYKKLYQIAKTYKMKGLIFMGQSQEHNLKFYYKLIKDNTNICWSNIFKKGTRSKIKRF
jgi:hypothetical protein